MTAQPQENSSVRRHGGTVRSLRTAQSRMAELDLICPRPGRTLPGRPPHRSSRPLDDLDKAPDEYIAPGGGAPGEACGGAPGAGPDNAPDQARDIES